MLNTQKMIVEAFGYKDPLAPNKTNFNITGKNQKLIHLINDNDSREYSMCGQIHPVGYTSDVDGAHLLKTMISDTYNECNRFEITNFICEYCGYSTIAYNTRGEHGKKMLNVLVEEGRVTRMDFFPSGKTINALYTLLKNPPKPPFVILINSRGKVLENLVFRAKPTLTKKWIVVNYGLDPLEVSPDEVFACLHDARVLASRLNIPVSSDQIFNRANNVVFRPNHKLVNNEAFVPLIGEFIGKYDRDCRMVAKMVQSSYLQEHKEPIRLPKQTEAKVSQGLFDF